MIEWGKEIAVNGRPAWLNDDMQRVMLTDDIDNGSWYGDDMAWYAHEVVSLPKFKTVAIRLPADHPAYRILELGEKLFDGTDGWMPWAGGDSAPDDWDGDKALLDYGVRSVKENGGQFLWDHSSLGANVIGYRPRVEKVVEAALPTYDPATHVLVERMTGKQAVDWLNLIPNSLNGRFRVGMPVLERLGVIKLETPAERIAAETGVSVEDVQKVLDAQ